VSLRQRLPGVATLASAAGGLRAAVYGTSGTDASVFRIDPATAKAAVTVEAGEVCCDLTAGDGSVWAVDPYGAVVPGSPSASARSGSPTPPAAPSTASPRRPELALE
jgi:hypothetical protein